MSHRSDDRYNALVRLTGGTGHVNDLLALWLRLGTIPEPPAQAALPDLWRLFLDSEGIPAGHINDRQAQWLAVQGHGTGTLADRFSAFWAAQAQDS